MTNLSLNWLSHGKPQKAAAIKKHLLVGLAAAALMAVGAISAPGATPGQNPGKNEKPVSNSGRGDRPVSNPGKGEKPAPNPPVPDVNVVNVTNPATAPVLAVNLNDPGRIPYQSMHTVTTPLSDHQFGSVFPTVPDGYRLVVQHVSGQVFFGNSPTAVTVTLTNLTADTQLRSIFPVPNSQAFEHTVLAYYDAGENPLVIITTDPQLEILQPSNFVGVTMTGYLVNCNIGSCAAIAN